MSWLLCSPSHCAGLVATFTDTVASVWLTRIEQAKLAQPGDAVLQYLAGVACLHLELWGKAQQLIKQALPRLHDHHMAARAWLMLADLAQRQGDANRSPNWLCVRTTEGFEMRLGAAVPQMRGLVAQRLRVAE